ncbi:DEAD/DEAH box helicase [Kitasatospora sp. A2-31]|uniref:DEAD/DEAH box helicase n=1 Tax=Kitasatospora sp. A2-31 TaxID=2916414 RepID=UPI001EEADF49|nr:AAA domain-containing protein [Kitasatospora sp. A2-31]MCG6497203.1 AAA domain-containing protein [Kitasatospora sp. A2-31]
MDRLRERSLILPATFSWSFSDPRDPVSARNSFDALISCLDSFEEERAAQREQRKDRADGDGLFELWARVLRAREDLARGDLQAVTYRSVAVRGREADFTLRSAPEQDLVGTEWQITLAQTGWAYGRGEVIRQIGSTLTLRSDRIFDKIPGQGMLAPSLGRSEASLARQRAAVAAIRTGSTARSDLRELILTPSLCAAPEPVTIDTWDLDLDGSKRAAVQSALGASDIFLVQGPPGTGKTSFIAETVAQYLRRNPAARILIVSQTHVAVDNALQRLDKAGINGLVRLGTPADARVNGSVSHLLLEQQMTRWASRVRRSAEKYLESQSESSGIAPHHLRAALALRELSAAIRESEKIELDLLLQGEDDPSEIATALTLTAEPSGLRQRLDALASLQEELRAQAQRELAGELTLHEGITLAESEAAVDLLIGESPTALALMKTMTLQAEWLQRIASDSALVSVFLETARVVAGTCVGFLGNPAVKALDLDLCILDEASKATVTEALVPMARAKRWILVGDTRQLPPMDEELLRSRKVLEEHELTREEVEETLFSRLAENMPEHSQLMLQEQYRMIRPIGDLISTCFYDGELRSSRVEGLRGYNAIFGKPVLWLDTSILGKSRSEVLSGAANRSYANPAEAKIIVDRLRALDGGVDKSVISLPDGRDRLEVLVIAPYSHQVEDLRRRTTAVQFRHLDVSVLSVDAAQGREADIAFFSVTRSNTEAKLGFLSADYWRRVNVALSRARFGLVIVGDAHFIRSTTGALRQVLEYVDGHSDDCVIRQADSD